MDGSTAYAGSAGKNGGLKQLRKFGEAGIESNEILKGKFFVFLKETGNLFRFFKIQLRYIF